MFRVICFNLSFRREQSTSRRFGGTGLGLVIAAQLVEQMGGTIQVDSELGKGFELLFQAAIRKGRAHPSAP